MWSLAPGVRLDHRFTLRDRLGAGGMSEVWLAEDEVLGRPVAVKVLTAELAADPTLPYLVMELVDGQTLADRLLEGPLPWPAAVAVCAQVAAALAAAHRIGVVHCDIKPGNVMLTRGGTKVLDFGIAALAGGHPAGDGTRTIGTPGYAAPERVRPGPAAPGSDVYALGVLLYETLTGHLPRPVGSWQEAAAAHRTAAPVPALEVPGLPAAVRELCLACLSADPAMRPAAEEAARVLGAAAGHAPATAVMPAVPAGAAAGPAVPAGYAVGSARLPHPPTMIDYNLSGPADAPVTRRRGQPLLFALLGAVAVLVLALVVLTAALLTRPTTSGSAQPPPASGAVTGVPSTSPTAAAPVPTATTPDAIADALQQVITTAQDSGQIDSDSADSLLGQINNLRDAHGSKRVGERAQQLQHAIGQLVSDQKIDQSTADQLTTLLQPLISTG
jgi:serine/threonine-protein kinase